MHTLYVTDRSAEKTLKRDSSVKYDPYQEKISVFRSVNKAQGYKTFFHAQRN